jgi:hypothetical protein
MLKQITLTGADDEVYIPDLIAISERYPFVEWGILLFDRKMGEPRYPTYSWIDSLIKRKTPAMRLSLHLCSYYNRNAALTSAKKTGQLYESFDRVQFNCGTIQEIDRCLRRIGYIPAVSSKNIIVGGDYTEVENLPDYISPLFDCSGGKGIEMTTVHQPYPNSNYTGYAGGLHVGNIFNINQLIEKAVGDTPYWLDMESSLRVGGIKFNLGKCVEILDMMEPLIK